MITSAFVELFTLLLGFIVSLLPTATLPSDVDSALSYVASSVGKFDTYFPIQATLTILTLVLSIEAGILIFRTVHFVYNKIRGSGS